MKVSELGSCECFTLLNAGEDPDREISAPYCCDLLSIAMGRMKAGSAWVTVMGNMNTIAVATLADASCIVLAEGSKLDEPVLNKAKEQGVMVFCTELPVFDAALMIYNKQHA